MASEASDTSAERVSGLQLIANERQRQIDHEGYDSAHDDSHERAELLQAAVWYIDNGCEYDVGLVLPPWPFESAAWKPSDDKVRQLAKGGALVAAEIDRLLRRRKNAELARRDAMGTAGSAGSTEELSLIEHERDALRAQVTALEAEVAKLQQSVVTWAKAADNTEDVLTAEVTALREENARLSGEPLLWCETCRDTHGPSGPHAGEHVTPDKAELLREIDQQHARELDASLSTQALLHELYRCRDCQSADLIADGRSYTCMQCGHRQTAEG